MYKGSNNLIHPLNCFGKDTLPLSLFPQKNYFRNKKFVFPDERNSFYIKRKNWSLFYNLPNQLQIGLNDSVLDLSYEYFITDTFEKKIIIPKLKFPLNKNVSVIIKYPDQFNINCSLKDSSMIISKKSFCFSSYNQSLDSYKYYILFTIGEVNNFISQVQYFQDVCLSFFYHPSKFYLVHSFHPFSNQNLLISSCFSKFWSSKIYYQNENYSLGSIFAFNHIVMDVELSAYLVKKFKQLQTGIEYNFMSDGKKSSFSGYLKIKHDKLVPSVLVSRQGINFNCKFHFSQNEKISVSVSKLKDTKPFICLKYINE